MRRLPTAILAAALLAGPLSADDLQRVVTFRDGSVLRVTLPDEQLTFRWQKPDGSVETESIDLGKIDDLTLSPGAPLKRLGEVTRLVGLLSSRKWKVRQEATKKLVEVGADYAAYLEKMRKDSSDLEVRMRLDKVLKTFRGKAPGQQGFDAVRRAGEKQSRAGDIGAWTATARRGAATLKLTRESVKRIASALPVRTTRAPVGPARPERITTDDERSFGKSTTRIAFENDPSGKKLTAGTDIGKTYIPKGFTISTSIKGAIVSINNFNVGGKSKGMSCATHQPLWEGTLTIRFCAPGNARIRAGVTRVGFYVASVSPNGTALEAYDARDRLIKKVPVVKSGTDFLAVRSNVPIAYIKVVPNMAIDSNYTIDDLVFDRPRPLTDVGDTSRFVVELRSGERIKCAGVTSPSGAGLTLAGLAIGGLEKLEVSRADVARVLTPLDGWKPGALSGRFWVMLTDGSIVRGTRGPKGPLGRTLKRGEIAAIWGDGKTYQEPPAGQPARGKLWRWDLESPIVHAEWSLEPDGMAIHGTTEFFLPYKNAQPMWLRPKPKAAEGAGRLRLISGEEYVLGGSRGLVLVSVDGKAVRLTDGNKPLDIPLSRVLSLSLPKKR